MSGFLSTARNNKKIGTDLYLVCSFTFKFPAIASKFFLRYRDGIFFVMPCNIRLPQKFQNIPGIAGNLKRFSFTLCE